MCPGCAYRHGRSSARRKGPRKRHEGQNIGAPFSIPLGPGGGRSVSVIRELVAIDRGERAEARVWGLGNQWTEEVPSPSLGFGSVHVMPSPIKLSARPMHYWVDAIFHGSFQAKRFETEREVMAYAQVHARIPDAEFVAVEACEAPGKYTTIWEWGEVEERWH
jgi:hypothetical protein